MQLFNALAHPPSAYAVVALVISGVALCVSFFAFTVAVKNYRRKAGMLVRGTFTTCSSVSSDSKFLSSLVIENLKDRAMTVFAIYLRIGMNYYVEIERFEDKPLILRAFETYFKEYGPIEFYSVNDIRLNLNALFDNHKAKKRLVLSTGDGKYVVPDQLRRWSPVYQFFQNHMTAVVRTVRTTHNGKDIGGNVKYVLDLVLEGGKPETIFIHPEDYQVMVFKKFQFTREALETKETLEAFLQLQVDQGNLVYKECAVLDMQKWREKNLGFYGKTYEATLFTPFQYHVLGRLSTMYRDWKQKREKLRRR